VTKRSKRYALPAGVADLTALMRWIKRKPSNPKKLKVILGDGFDPTLEIGNPKTILDREDAVDPQTLSPEDHAVIWHFYEYARMKTYNQCPDRTLFYVLRLAEEDIVSTVVTPNYDCYWPSIKNRKASRVKLAINPLEHPPVSDKYYEKRETSKCLKIFTMHGRLDFVRFNSCRHRFALPLFLLRPTIDPPPPEFKVPLWHCWLDHEKTMCDSTGIYRHDIDWLNNDFREPYKPEIETATSDISDLTTTAGILVLGFVGYCSPDKNNTRRQEELVSVLEHLAKNTNIPIWVINTSNQYDSMEEKGIGNCLPGKIKGLPNVHVVPIKEPIRTWLGDTLNTNASSIGISTTLDQDFKKKWEESSKFMPRIAWPTLNARRRR
jgi:hypothetical protein